MVHEGEIFVSVRRKRLTNLAETSFFRPAFSTVFEGPLVAGMAVEKAGASFLFLLPEISTPHKYRKVDKAP